ncbi:NF038129 family PEP-CTERM protein [Methylomonas sp. AM2-LC]|uniref:NF038129 family PEP-CTERM protein n=1 Tax=Methylomonas sp. AM2-LC TaxID=3153301 RepID=UPI003262FAB6
MIQNNTFRYYLLTIIVSQFILMSAHATQIVTDIITTPYIGTNAELVFDFVAGDGNLSNSITLSGFTTDGDLSSANPTTQGDVTGSLQSSVVLKNTQFFNELIQPIKLGNSLTFNFTATENFDPLASVPDSFSIYLLDSNGSSLFTTTDITTANSLLLFSIDGTASGSLTLNKASSDITNPVIWKAGVPDTTLVPIPGTFGLFSAAIMAFIFKNRRHIVHAV